MSSPTVKYRGTLTLVLLGGANLLVWLVALVTFRRHALVLGTASLAYTFGLRHALDADHIAAIDNVTRKLMQDGKRPLLVGFYFSLGHSTVVVLLSLVMALAGSRIQTSFPAMMRVGGLIGTGVSAFFLLAIAVINFLVLRTMTGCFRRIKGGKPCDECDVDDTLNNLGILTRIWRPVLSIVNQSWKMYGIGFLFGLGFDTATEVALLGISATAATQGISIWSTLLFPLLFTSGMSLLDTADGVLMVGAYGWAYVHPIRKLYYNMTITAVSIVFAVAIGVIEILGIVGDRFDLHGRMWNRIASVGDHFGTIGAAMVCLFAGSWIASALCYRLLGYHRLERGRLSRYSDTFVPIESTARGL